MDLDLLRTFHAVHRTGTLTAAARLLGVSQPTVTAHLRTLEERAGQPLFRRHARGVAATPAGDDLARRLDGPLDELAGIAADLRRAPVLAGRTLTLGGPAEFLAERVLGALAGTMSVGVAVRVRPGLSADLLADLVAGQLDLVVSTVRPRHRGLVAEALCDEEFVLVAAPTIAATADLARLPLLAYAEDLPVVRRWWRHVLGVAPPHRAALVAPDLRALRAAACAGAGVTVLPRYLCDDDLAAGRLVDLYPTDDPPINTLYLAARTAAGAEPHIAHAWAALRHEAARWGA